MGSGPFRGVREGPTSDRCTSFSAKGFYHRLAWPVRLYKAADFPVYDWFTLDKESSIFPPPRVFQLIFPVHKTWVQPNAPPSPPSASVLRGWCWLVLGACAWDSDTDAYLRELKLFFTSVYLISSTACFAAFFGSLIKAHSFSGLRLDHVFFSFGMHAQSVFFCFGNWWWAQAWLGVNAEQYIDICLYYHI